MGYPLSPRELQILPLVAAGNTTEEIAEQLRISPRTVETHRKHIMAKTGIERPAGWIKYAMRLRLIDPLTWAHSDPMLFKRGDFDGDRGKIDGNMVRWVLIGVPVILIIWSLALWAVQGGAW